MKKPILIAVIFTIFVLALAQANAEIKLTRSLPLNVSVGANLYEEIEITSTENIELSFIERVPPSLKVIEPGIENLRLEPTLYGYETFINYNITLTANKPYSLRHIFKARIVGFTYLPSIQVETDSGYFEFEAKQIFISCNLDGDCDREFGENYIYCPDDCSTGIEDSICDGARDGICDPDCIEYDSDCGSSCGDGTCDEAKENIYNCPEDCGKAKSINNWRILDYYLITFQVTDNTLKLKEIKKEHGTYYEQFPSSDNVLTFKLLDKKGNLITVYRKSFSYNTREFTIKIPYSPIATQIAVGNQKYSLSQFADYCGDAVCQDKENELNCPIDCGNFSGSGSESLRHVGGMNITILIIVMTLIFVFLIVLLYMSLLKKRH